MDYCRLYASLRDDPKMLGLPDRSFRRHIEAMCWVTEHETDGRVPPVLVPERDAAILVNAGLWDQAEDGYVIHNWLGRQRSKDEMDAVRIAGRKAARIRWGNGSPNAEVEVEVEREVELVQDPAPPQDLTKVLTESTKIAAALLAEDTKAQHFLRRMKATDARWEALTNGALMKLGKKYGADCLITAMGYLYEEGAVPFEPYPYLESVCVRVQAERAS